MFSSILADDIDLNRAKSRGARALKTFLAYAKLGILETAPVGGGEHDSDFELEVANAITNAGYAVVAQVGVAGDCSCGRSARIARRLPAGKSVSIDGPGAGTLTSHPGPTLLHPGHDA